MTIAPVSEQDAKRRIGDILRELGFVTEAQLTKASEEQDQTGQPLGQILVEHGAITRLELASALAEQWSAHAPITPLPVHPPANRVAPLPPAPVDEDQYAARLQAAVADLAGKGQATATTTFEATVDTGQVRELAERLEATVARAQRLEATVATLAESMDGVTGGIEEAFNVLQSGMAGLALDLARLDTTVADLSLRATEPPPPDPELVARLGEVEARLDTTDGRAADAAAVEALAARIESATDLDDALASTLEALRLRVDDLARPEHGPGADAMRRVEKLEARLGEMPAALADLRRELAERDAEDLSPRVDGLAARVEALAGDLDELPRDPQADAVRELVTRMDVLESAREARTTELERLDLLEATVRDGVAAPAELHALSERVERELAGAEEIRATLTELAGRLDAGIVTPSELAAAVEALQAELRATPSDPDPRIDSLTEAITEIREEADARRQALDERFAQLVTPTQLADAVEEAAQRIASAGPDAETVAQLTRLGAQIDLLGAPSEGTAALVSRLESLEGGIVTPGELEAALAKLRNDLLALIPPPAAARPAPEPDPRIATLQDDLDALQEAVARSSVPASDPALAVRIDNLEARIADAAESVEAAPDPPTEAALLQLLEPRLADLTGQIEAIAELARRAPSPTEPAAAGGTGSEHTADGGIDERIETELEKTRMAIERLSAHLGEHDRALRELMKDRTRADEAGATAEERVPLDRGEAALDMRSIQRRLDGIEEDAREDREKLMKRLERMATSIDWRLQRLEADETP